MHFSSFWKLAMENNLHNKYSRIGEHAANEVFCLQKNVIKQGHGNKPAKSAGSCVDLDQ